MVHFLSFFRLFFFSLFTNSFLRKSSVFTVTSIALCFCAFVTVASVLDGFERAFFNTLIPVVSPLQVQSHDFKGFVDRDRQLEGMTKHDPSMQIDSLMRVPFLLSVGRSFEPVEVQVRPLQALDAHVSHKMNITMNNMEDKGKPLYIDTNDTLLVVGKAFAKKHGLTLGVSQTLTFMDSTGYHRVSARLAGISYTGTEYDQQHLFLFVPEMSRFESAQVTFEHRIDISDPQDFLNKQHFVQSKLRVRVDDWRFKIGYLYQAIALPKAFMWLVLFFIVIISMFSIVSNLSLFIQYKYHDIALLQTLGMGRRRIISLYFMVMLCILITGMLIGSVLGVLLSLYLPDIVWLLERMFSVSIFSHSSYFISELPIDVDLWQITVINVSALVLGALACIYPARVAFNKDPVQYL